MTAGLGLARRLAANAGVLVRRSAARLLMPPGSGFWIRVRLAPPLEELLPPRLLGGREASLALLDLLTLLERAARDPEVDGVLLELAGGVQGFAMALPLRRAVAALETAGKPVVAWGESLSTEEFLVGSAARRLYVAEAGGVALVGLRLEGFFLRDLLGRLGVSPEVVRIGSFKSAAESFTRDAFSPENREQLEALLDDRFGELVRCIAQGRGLEEERVRELIDRGPHGGRGAAEAGLVDGCRYADELPDELWKLGPPRPQARGPRPRLLDAASYHGLCVAASAWQPLAHDLPRIAYVVARGAIHRGGGLRGVAADPYRKLFAALAGDAGVRGVVLRVDSPGGDALASDALWRAVWQLRREKPVVASLGEVAASGGYYLASAADRILAEGPCVTGSIGVVGGKLNLGPLYERVGIGRDGVERGARAGMGSEARGFTPEERAAVRGEMEQVYGLFLERVASGRGLARAAVHRVAEGRIWSGAAAHAHGLVDALGGPLESLDALRRLAGLLPGEPALVDLHPRLPRLGSLRSLVAGRIGG